MSTENKNLLHAARKQPVSRVPVWFMRQAGRSLPEYFPVRGEGSILDAISVPERAAEITMQPVRRYDVDAAILFSDIVTPIWASGFGIDITPGVGPECENPFRGADDLTRLRPLDPDKDLKFQTDAIKILVNDLDVPLIGFAGAPFTLAAYLIEGRPSRTYDKVKTLMMSDEKLWHSLCNRLADAAICTLASQVEAGAEAIQLFDSWAGALHPNHYRRFVAPHSAKIFAAMADLGIPRFHFGINSGELLDQFADVGPDVVGVDWHTSISSARERTQNRVALQGNLDPAICLAPWDVVEAEVKRILADNNGDLGYVFNLGHGVLPNTDPETLEQVVKLVHEIGISYQQSEPVVQ